MPALLPFPKLFVRGLSGAATLAAVRVDAPWRLGVLPRPECSRGGGDSALASGVTARRNVLVFKNGAFQERSVEDTVGLGEGMTRGGCREVVGVDVNSV